MTADASSPDPLRWPETPPLSLVEARVLGSLIEKELTTPDVYPLSLNGLVNACNQRNNRDPVLSLGQSEVEAALDQLRQRRLVALVTGGDARVPKFKQTLDNSYPVDVISRALLGELLLRGPQTTASLRGNAERLCGMPDAGEVEQRLTDLSTREAAPLVAKLPRQPGQKEGRWAQLFTGAALPTEQGTPLKQALAVEMVLPSQAEARLQALEAEVASLRAELQQLKAALGVS